MKKICAILLPCLVLISLCTSLFAQPTELKEEGRAYFDFGVFAFEEQKYSSALENFKKALTFNAENAYYNYYLGKTYLQMERYKEAEKYLEKARQINPDIAGLTYDRAFLRYKTGDFSGASELFRQVASEESANVLGHYFAGITLFKQEKYEDAVPYFTYAAENSPTIKANGFYYAGICYQKTGQIDRSIKMFKAAQSAPDAGALNESASQWIAALEQQKKLEKPYNLYLKLGRRYDDNVQLEPDDLDIISDESDWATLFYGSGRYDFMRRDAFKLSAAYSHYQTWYDDLDQYNLIGALPSLSGEYSLNPLVFRLTFLPTYYWADSDSYLRELRLEPEIRWRTTDNLLTRFLYRYNDTKYFDETGRSGHSNEFYADAYYALFGGKNRLFGGIGYEDYSATASAQYYTQLYLRAGAFIDLPWEMELGVSAQYQAKNYDNVDPIYLVERDDDKYIGAISLSRPIVYEWLGILGEYRYIRNDSNINDFEYTRNLFTISLTATF